MTQRSLAAANARRERFLAVVADPSLIGQICERIAEGATLIDLCAEWDIKYQHLHAWIHDERYPERVRNYAIALEGRGHYVRDKVTKALMQFVDADLSKAFDRKGNLLHPSKIPPELRAVLQGLEISYDKAGTKMTKLKIVDKLGAANSLGRTAAMFVDKIDVKHSGTVGLAARLAGARQRVINGTAKEVPETLQIPVLGE